MDTLISTGDAAVLLGVSTKTVVRYLERGRIAGHLLPSGHWRVVRVSVVALSGGRPGVRPVT